MKVVVIGATGTIGQAIVDELGSRHEVVSVGHSDGEFQLDISDETSIEKMYSEIKNIDAVVMATGAVHFGPLLEMSSKDYALGLNNKLMGQVNVVLMGLKHVNDGGSFTLTSGILNRDPIVLGSSAAMVNGAIDGFVTGAAIEMPRHLRINAVSPTVVTESIEKYGPFFRGFESVAAHRVAQAFSKSVEGAQTGQVYGVT